MSVSDDHETSREDKFDDYEEDYLKRIDGDETAGSDPLNLDPKESDKPTNVACKPERPKGILWLGILAGLVLVIDIAAVQYLTLLFNGIFSKIGLEVLNSIPYVGVLPIVFHGLIIYCFFAGKSWARIILIIALVIGLVLTIILTIIMMMFDTQLILATLPAIAVNATVLAYMNKSNVKEFYNYSP